MTPHQTVVGIFDMITAVKAIGLPLAQGRILTKAFYCDRDDASRAFARCYAERMPGRVPTENHAGGCSSVLAYLRAVKQADSIDGNAIVAGLRPPSAAAAAG